MSDALLPYGWGDRWLALFTSATEDRPAARPGRVVRHDGVALLVATDAGIESFPLPIDLEPAPVVGDWLVLDDGAIVEVLDRASLLRRSDAAGNEQHLVANLDTLLIVCGLDRPVKAGRIQRSAALAWDAGATPMVALTKADLHEDPEAVADEVRAANPGVDVIITSARSGDGLDAVRDLASGKSTTSLVLEAAWQHVV